MEGIDGGGGWRSDQRRLGRSGGRKRVKDCLVMTYEVEMVLLGRVLSDKTQALGQYSVSCARIVNTFSQEKKTNRTRNIQHALGTWPSQSPTCPRSLSARWKDADSLAAGSDSPVLTSRSIVRLRIRIPLSEAKPKWKHACRISTRVVGRRQRHQD